MPRRPLLFFVSDAGCAARTAATATLAWLAEQAGSEFDAYIPVRLFQRPGSPAISPSITGNRHDEQFYFLAGCFDLTFCSLASEPPVPFRREAATFGARLVPHRHPDELAVFYREVFALYGQPLPDHLVVIPTPGGDAAGASVDLEPYCYADVFYRRALGVPATVADAVLRELRAAGVQHAAILYCGDEVAARLAGHGFTVEMLDRAQPDDTCGSVTARITDRWLARGRGIAFGNQALTVKMLPFLMRHDLLPLYEPQQWRSFAATVGSYAHRLGNPLVWGNQTVEPRPTDDVITEFARHDVAMSLGVGICGPTVQERLELAREWLPQARAPWEVEYPDELLEQKAREGAIAVCYVLYAADLGHLTVYPRLFDVMAAWYGRCGLAFPSTWYDFNAEALQLLYLPESLGGVFPRVEPLLSSAGLGVATEAAGFLQPATLRTLLAQAIESIRRHVGPEKVPIGYLPWQDACPYYRRNSGEPQFAVLREAGFRYCITRKNEGDPPHIVYQDGDFVALNTQNVHWRVQGSLLAETRRWEQALVSAGRSGWILLDLDSPFWFQIPHYFDPELPAHYDFEASIVEFATALRYVDRGGESGRLFLARPHEVARFARILQRLGRLQAAP